MLCYFLLYSKVSQVHICIYPLIFGFLSVLGHHEALSKLLLCSQFSFSSVQFSLSVMSDSLRPHGLQYIRASLSITNSQSLLKLMSIGLVMPSNYLILCRPLLLLPSIIPNIRVFSNKSALRIRWPKYWSFSFSINPSNEYSGLIPFRMDWLALLLSKGLSSLLQHTVQKHQFFSAQPSLYNVVGYMSIPISQFIPPSLSPLGVHTFVLYVCL